ncbi:MAG TPA: glycosyltransferase, partial [Chloroflexota bacterium]|nr:glycosyltransferase [Chloroflexota bacterium]
MENADRWERMYSETPLCQVPQHYLGVTGSPYMIEYLKTVLSLCPRGGRTCETGIGSGYGAVWLSLRGIAAEGIDNSPALVERARQVNNILGGSAVFRCGDLLSLYNVSNTAYEVIHHQGVLEHFTVPQVHAALAQQAASAQYVVFSVPSAYYPFDPEFGDERMMPLSEWERILSPFEVEELRYYGDPRLGGREQILGILRGQPADETLLALMKVPPEPYPEGISAIVHTRNEGHQIADCLETLKRWTDEIIVCDMESTDDTVEIASKFADQIISHPQIANFDRARNVSAMRARYRWIFYLDADERAPAELGKRVRELTQQAEPGFEAVLTPFRHIFAGHWMQCLYPGYTAPRLLKNGRFHFNARLHSGAVVDGRVIAFPAGEPSLALEHQSFPTLYHYLEKLNRYTDGEADNMHRDGQRFHWQLAVRRFVQDYQMYWTGLGAARDGVHGFLYSFLSGFYRFHQYGKLFERRLRAGQLTPEEGAVPASLEEMLEFALSVAREKPRPQATPIRVERGADGLTAGPGGSSGKEAPGSADRSPVAVVWSGPLRDPSGYGEESRHLLFALEEAGLPVVAQSLPWGGDESLLPAPERQKLDALVNREASTGFIQIVHNFAPFFETHPDAGVRIGRTLFETDRLPPEWVRACNRMDAVWVASEFNRQTFSESGVDPAKLVVIPECLDPAAYLEPRAPEGVVRGIAERKAFRFLSVFDWTLHKGWDALLRAFLEAFPERDDVALVLKVWSTMGYTPESLREQACGYVREEMGLDLEADGRIVFLQERLSPDQLIALYHAVDAYVMPSRGEGWGRPFIEAMACGLPTIGVGWSGNRAFMTPENSFLVDFSLLPVPEQGYREVAAYRGHRWAEPDREHLKEVMCSVVERPEAARERGRRAQRDIAERFSRQAVGPLMRQALEAYLPVSAGDARPQEAPAAPAGDPAAAGDAAQGGAVSGGPASPCEEERPHDGAVALPAIRADRGDPVAVRWEGAQFVWHSLSHVNRELCLGLLRGGRVELSLVPTEPDQFRPEDERRFLPLAERCFRPLSRPADVHVRHHFPPRFDPPDEGRLVIMQPWEYGFLPQAWIEPLRKHVSEVWCESGYVMDVYRASGIAEEKLQVIPHGVDTRVFRPEAPPYVFTTEPGAQAMAERSGERFVFLWVGGTLHRKGFDILLDAYVRAFSAFDDVCLVVKDTCTKTVYRGQNQRERILELAQDRSRPCIVYVEDDLTPHQLAGIYAGANCLVQPYRGE